MDTAVHLCVPSPMFYSSSRPESRRALSSSAACHEHAPDNEHGHVRPLFRGELVVIGESSCAGEMPGRWQPGRVGDAFEIVIARRGAYVLESAAGRTLAHPGIAMFGNPRESFRISHPIPGGDACSVFHVSPDALNAMLSDGMEGTAPEWTRFPIQDLSLDGPVYLAHRLAVRAARTANPSDAISMLTAEERAIEFLDAIGTAMLVHAGRRGKPVNREATNGRAREYVMRVREVIARRFHEPLTLRDVARCVGCSPYHLSRIVTAYEGAPIYRLIVRHRLRHALESVLATTDSLSTIALDAGFASQSHFGDSFRREFGCAPGVARRIGRCA